MLIDLSSGHIVVLAQADIEVSLVVSKIQIRLSTIVQDVHLTCSSVHISQELNGQLTVFGRSHSSSINVHVRIDFDSSDLKTGGFEEKTGTGSFGISLGSP
jgi:hypothetical protein